MRSLYLRIWLTVVAVLLLFALVAGFVAQRNLEREREEVHAQWRERAAGWAALIENSLPRADASVDEQRAALLDWSHRLRLPLALDDADGRRIATDELLARREAELGGMPRRTVRLPLSDGRVLWLWRPGAPGRAMMERRMDTEGALARPGAERPPAPPAFAGRTPPWLPGGGLGLVLTMVVLFVAVALGAYPVVRRLTRRLEALKRGVEVFGAGRLSHRVDASGRDEVAAVAASFNDAAARIEKLVASHRDLLANASHELRSPLTRMKMALSLLEGTPPEATEQRARLKDEVERNIAELDALVEEVLLASRLDAQRDLEPPERVDLLALAAEEGARFDAVVSGDDVSVQGSERLLRRALRNLLENARRYGGEQPPEVSVKASADEVRVAVADRGPGVPETERERIFEPFYRLPGHAEKAGGVGLGLSLVRQIAERHRGRVRVAPRPGGGSAFEIALPRG
ncbi:MAG TPA: HAMP domain-containing sensor histidine kinase [Ideonella sp.]|nr:HAMP domain-containing sensor histidine kinase [Ideonella sp.]